MGTHQFKIVWFLCTLVLLIMSGCGEYIPNPIGAGCSSDEDCTLRFCYYQVCMEPGADDDGDGIINFVERELGTHPFSTDSDNDGLLDNEELGEEPSAPLDTDEDGTPDILESLYADQDSDCLGDQYDADDTQPTTDMALIREKGCPTDGICADQVRLIHVECSDGLLICGYSDVKGFDGPQEAACDAIDGDCDGTIDDDFTFKGAGIGTPCTPTTGCGTGIVVCTPGGKSATCSVSPEAPAGPDETEICDYVDNDCDGETDEDQEWNGLLSGTPCVGVGVCSFAPGVVECSPQTHQAQCSSGPGGSDSPAQAETCDGVDNNCDGQTDEDLFFQAPDGSLLAKGTPCEVGECAFGVVVCDPSESVTCSSLLLATPEICDDKDNDCDGQIDDGMTYIGLPIGAPCEGLGECGDGLVECIPNTTLATCSSQSGGSASEATVETCDGLDNDCDGLADNQLNVENPPLGTACEGECGDGVFECAGALGVVCTTNPAGSDHTPTDEICDGLDNDCDGETDEELPPSLGGDWMAVTPKNGPAPSGRSNAASALDPAAQQWYVHGGWTQDEESPVIARDTWRLNLPTLQWELVHSPGAEDVSPAGPIAWDDVQQRLIAIPGAPATSSELWAWVPESPWTPIPSLPSPEWPFALIAASDLDVLIVLTHEPELPSNQNVWALNLLTNEWNSWGSLPTDLAAPAAGAWDIGSQRALVTGTHLTEGDPGVGLWSFDPASLGWAMIGVIETDPGPDPPSILLDSVAQEALVGVQGQLFHLDLSVEAEAFDPLGPAPHNPIGGIGVYDAVGHAAWWFGGIDGNGQASDTLATLPSGCYE